VANTGNPDSGGCQFFITTDPESELIAAARKGDTEAMAELFRRTIRTRLR
jgi:cyclophilin family peptidyl-prolyl cis-trans isomerase